MTSDGLTWLVTKNHTVDPGSLIFMDVSSGSRRSISTRRIPNPEDVGCTALEGELHLGYRSACDGIGRSGRYIPLVDVRTILTGVSSRISTISLLPDEAAAWASAVRDKDDDFGSRSPPNIDWLSILYLGLCSRCLLAYLPRLRLGDGLCFFQEVF
jgi:hypothetical protein